VKKEFDCVRMKWEIQRRQREEMPGTSEAEKRRLRLERVEADLILGPFLKRLRRMSHPAP
jgi:hypothetical protein